MAEEKLEKEGRFEMHLAAITQALGRALVVYLAIVVLAYAFIMFVKSQSGALCWPWWARPDNLDIWWGLVGLAEKLGWVMIAAWVFCRSWIASLRKTAGE